MHIEEATRCLIQLQEQMAAEKRRADEAEAQAMVEKQRADEAEAGFRMIKQQQVVV